MKDEKIPRVLIKHTFDTFNKVLILEYTTEIVVCFFCKKEEFEKVKSELEKYGKVVINTEFGKYVAVEVHTDSKEKVGKIWKILTKIKLEDIGIDGMKVKERLDHYLD